MDTDIDTLLVLSGMLYHQGRSRQHWIDTVDIDPETVPEVKMRGDKCVWTTKAEDAVKRHISSVHANWHAIGINAG